MNINVFFFVFLIVGCLISICSTVNASNQFIKETAFDYMNKMMDRFHKVFYVYSDADLAGNHFVARGRIASDGEEVYVPPMNEHYSKYCHSGDTCIRSLFISTGINWGGWYFMNGVLSDDETEPSLNWGDFENAGVPLTGAKRLTFFARGEKGDEQVEFFAFGLGRDPDTGTAIIQHPDSSRKISTGNIRLTKEWKRYSIDVSGVDLSYVIGGFGWVANSINNKGNNIIFYLDDIQYDLSRLEEPRLITSFETSLGGMDIDSVMRNVAFTYDNAVALIAYIANGDIKRAKLIADALVFAHREDRTFRDGRIRNAYKASEIELFSGWHPHGKEISSGIPGFSCPNENDPDKYRWCEDEFQVSTHTGNVAWAMLALLAYYEVAGGEQYLDVVKQLGEWIVTNCSDNEKTPKGYTAGYEGWEINSRNPRGPKKLTYKATEHNIDLYSAFRRLYRITQEKKWYQRAELAKNFIMLMWDDKEGKFWTGTGEDGITINKEVIPLDIQAWSVQALGEEYRAYWRALNYAEKHHAISGGFDFNEKPDGIWYEGTAQMAVAYLVTGQPDKWKKIMQVLDSTQRQSGAMFAASKNGLTTGFFLSDGKEWLYFSREHLGATAWYALAKTKTNPFLFMQKGK